MEDIFVIAGLGNPGDKYSSTRHNVGFNTIDYLSKKYYIRVNKIKFKALIGEGLINGKKVILVKPQTFMNLSGESIREILSFYKIKDKNFIVIYDDIDLPVGKIRIKPQGSSGTHNGMKSIIYLTNNDKFPRVRIGTGKPPQGWDLADYVLSKFGEDEKKLIEEAIEVATEAVVAMIDKDIDFAMNTYNK